MKRITAQDIEIAVARHFNYRVNIIVPNVYWGFGLRYEADLVVLRPSGWAEEIEIKITAADIKADLKKPYHHDSPWFRKLWFAVPAMLAAHPDIPTNAGIMCLDPELHITVTRAPRISRNARRMTDSKIRTLLRLGCMRIWTLKSHLARQRSRP